MGLIALDSCIFIYILDKNPDFFDKALIQLHRIDNEASMASILVYTEVLAKLQGDTFIQAKRFLDELGELLTFQPIDKDTAIRAAELRAKYGPILKTADAIQLAAALQSGADVFVTNDQSLARLKIPHLNIQVL